MCSGNVIDLPHWGWAFVTTVCIAVYVPTTRGDRGAWQAIEIQLRQFRAKWGRLFAVVIATPFRLLQWLAGTMKKVPRIFFF
jgi:hypothetical protein